MIKKKSLNKNFIVASLYQVTTTLIPIFTVYYITRILGADRIGAFSYSTSICSYFVIASTLGFYSYGQREIAFYQDNPAEYSRVFKELQLLRAVITPTILVVYFIYIATLGRDKILLLILSINIVNSFMDISWFYAGLEEFQKISWRSISIKLLYVISIYTFVKSKSDFYLYCFIEVLHVLAISMSLWIGIKKYLVPTAKLNWTRHFKPVIALFIPSLAIQLYTVLDKSMIGFFSSQSYNENGYYELAQNLVKAFLVLSTTMGSVSAPRISFAIARNDYTEMRTRLYNSYRFVWATAIPLMIILNGITSRIVPLYYGQGYKKVAELIHLFSPLILAIGLSNVSGIQYFIPKNLIKIYTASLITGAVINLILNLLFIPHFYSIGATVASVIAEWSVTICQLIMVIKLKELKITHIFHISIRYWICGIILSAFTYYLNKVLPFSISGVIAMIILLLVCYLILLLISRDKYVLSILKRTIRKGKN